MEVIKNTFDPEAHEQALQSFKQRLKKCGYHMPGDIEKVVIDPNSIAGMQELLHIQKDGNPKVIIGNVLLIVVAIDITTLNIYFEEGETIKVPVGNPTKKGYRSKQRDFERFAVNEQLALYTKALNEMEKFVHHFQEWETERRAPRKASSDRANRANVYGYPLDFFGGDASSYWNID